MATAQRTKASDKQGICKKLVSLLKKRYKGSIPKSDRAVLETILYGICLENGSVAQADIAYDRLESEFHDLNEVRVSSIVELETAFRDMRDPEWRALRVRSALQYIFEKNFSFEFEGLRRKTLDLAGKHLARIKQLSHFVRIYTLQQTLGGHVIPLDDCMRDAAVALGLLQTGLTPERASEAMKSAIRKADAPLFCHLLRSFSTDPKAGKVIGAAVRKAPEEGYDVGEAPSRLEQLFKQADSRSRTVKKKKPAKKGNPDSRSAGRTSPGTKKTATKKGATPRAVKKKTTKRSRIVKKK